MANKKDKKHNHDGHWKFIIDGHFEKFIEFFMPDLYSHIDFSRKPDSLEKELLKISMDVATAMQRIFSLSNKKLARYKLAISNLT